MHNTTQKLIAQFDDIINTHYMATNHKLLYQSSSTPQCLIKVEPVVGIKNKKEREERDHTQAVITVQELKSYLFVDV